MKTARINTFVNYWCRLRPSTTLAISHSTYWLITVLSYEPHWNKMFIWNAWRTSCESHSFAVSCQPQQADTTTVTYVWSPNLGSSPFLAWNCMERRPGLRVGRGSNFGGPYLPQLGIFETWPDAYGALRCIHCTKQWFQACIWLDYHKFTRRVWQSSIGVVATQVLSNCLRPMRYIMQTDYRFSTPYTVSL